MKHIRIIIATMAAVAVSVFSAQAQTNKEAVESAEQALQQKQKELSETQRAADKQISQSQTHIGKQIGRAHV